MPLPPHRTITTLDFASVELQIQGLTLVAKAAEEFSDPDSQRFATHVRGAIAALTWVVGGPAGSDLYAAQTEGEQLLLDARRNAEAAR